MRFLKKTNKYALYKKILFILVLLSISTGCAARHDNTDGSEKQNTEFEKYFFKITDADLYTDANDPVYINLDEQKDKVLVISDDRDYILSGKYSGQIQIDVDDLIAHIILNGVEIKSNNGPAINMVSGGKLVITINENTDNIISDSINYKGYEGLTASIYGASDLTINGSGNLSVYGFFSDGIKSKDILKLIGGNIFVKAKEDGIRGNDGICIASGKLRIECEDYGIRTTKQKKGAVEIYGGNVDIIAGRNGIYAAENLYVYQCSINCNSILEMYNVKGECYIEEGCIE